MAADDDRHEIFTDRRGHYRWRRISVDGEVVGAASEGYARRADCEANMARGRVPTDKWDFYKDRRGAFRWRRYAMNGRVVGAASRGFPSMAEAQANARRLGWDG